MYNLRFRHFAFVFVIFPLSAMDFLSTFTYDDFQQYAGSMYSGVSRLLKLSHSHILSSFARCSIRIGDRRRYLTIINCILRECAIKREFALL